MKTSLRPPGPPLKASDSLDHRLHMYVLAATSAGVSVLALAQPAEGRIVYTKTNVKVFQFGGGSYNLDLNNDGSADFSFSAWAWETTGSVSSQLFVDPCWPNKSNAIWRGGYSVRVGGAAALKAGVRVGPRAPFADRTLIMGQIISRTSRSRRYYRGSWENAGKGVRNRYLGLMFHIKGKIHYGWARLNFPSPQGATLTGYAYETIAGKPIVTGKTGMAGDSGAPTLTLGRLALGRK